MQEGADTDDDDSLDQYPSDIEKDELAYLVQDQKLDIINGNQVPMLYYPNISNRLYAYMRILTIRHFYTFGICFMALSFCLLLVHQVEQHYSNLRQNGYCDSFNSGSTAPCIPCPPHGECIDGRLYCHPLYQPYRSTFNTMVNLVWPTSESCIKDPKMLKLASKIQDKIINYIARRQGDSLCRKYIKKTPDTMDLPRTHVSSMMDALKSSFGLPPAINQSHQIALDHLLELGLNLTMENPHVSSWVVDGALYLAVDHVKYSPMCWVLVTYSKTPLTLTIGVPLLLTFALVLWNRWKKNRQVKIITNKALNLLKEQRQKHLKTPVSSGPGCTVNYLRLHVMTGTDATDVNIWRAVIYKLQNHPCIRNGHSEEHGEIVQYFEWL
ncbi:Man1-Src1p-C-terminal domain-containing protein [Chlamydoabsidia padenii]|nr:Man1-Src1p-C-terminal domain-containing protein [Chlamydoabsidia padenii]